MSLLNRRRFLTRAGAAAATVGAAGAELLANVPPAAAQRAAGASTNALELDGPAAVPVAIDPNATLPPVPFHGAHQAGITTPRPASSAST